MTLFCPGNQRHFQRFLHSATCSLYRDDTIWTTEVIDFSLKGALVRRPDGWNCDPGALCELSVELGDGQTAIIMAVMLRHDSSIGLGFECDYIDLESAEHLRRLVELNLGSPTGLERELTELIAGNTSVSEDHTDG